jgi:hypothetical protein
MRIESIQHILNSRFPYGIPDALIPHVGEMYTITNELLKLNTAYHQTSTSALIFPNHNGEFIKPAVGINSPMNASLIVRNAFPNCYEYSVGRPLFSWWGKNIMTATTENVLDLNPNRINSTVFAINIIETIYKELMEGNASRKDQLHNLLFPYIQGAWLEMYSQNLPDELLGRSDDHFLYPRFEDIYNHLDQAKRTYGDLDSDSRLLLDKAFNFIVKAEMRDDIVYMYPLIHPEIKRYLPSNIQVRNPLEIVGEPRPVTAQQVKTIYFPDSIMNTDEATIAISRLREIGISTDKIKPQSCINQAGTYDVCQQRYGHFSIEDVINRVYSGDFKPINW